MPVPTPPIRVHTSDSDLDAALLDDVRRGLTSTPKSLPPKWFYDAVGSELFERITRLPEYYPTRTETALLREAAPEIVGIARPHTMIELGSGSSEKTRILLDAGVEQGELQRYLPQDVSVSALQGAVAALRVDYPGLEIEGIVGEFADTIDRLPPGERRMVTFLGGTIGNMVPAERAVFLAAIAAALDPGETLLLGAGLVTDPAVLVPAYDDAEGVTAEFNRNVLRVLNERLGADFDPEAFAHVALWDAANEWIEMRLKATRAMRVAIPGADLTVDLAAGEQILTEISAKFREDGLRSELSAAGFTPDRIWTDPQRRFALILAHVPG
ncbi:dimethylhistidine N-methyltransferase [Tsukamurella pulmonis]|uniref:L-histidine N(alpha)-methyltransferase n=1 Tax=Tsukamurella pulmonis TaxID=47312 RepID=UPI0007933EF8|nr:dimethylhistidine N-methyltransferase [Tsukamurella pulmonis]